jgi:excinuclease ABC subunit C
MEKEIVKQTRFVINKKTFAGFPETPGIYIFWQKNTPIYVGKAVNLRSRLGSYLNLNLGPKTAIMVGEADSVSFIKVTTELESLLLEARLIRHFMPRYNIVAKDDKNPLYIAITKEEFPRILSVRKLETKGQKLTASFGPFPNSTNVKTILRMVRRAFPYSDHKNGKKACLYNHLGLCDPCPNVISGFKNEALKKLEVKKYRSNIRNIKRLLEGKFSVIQKDLLNTMRNLSENQDYEEAAKIRSQLMALDYVIQPRIEPGEFIENPNLEEDLKQKELKLLLNILSVYYPRLKSVARIECFDIAHLAGSAATASMVVFIDGEADKSEYRHFKVRQLNSQSDYDSLEEIANRRLNNKDWDKPDLVIVDGGLGQVKKFFNVFKASNVAVVGIAKHPDRLIFPDGKKVPATRLTQRIRDEAHRFARRYHHLLLKKNLLSF